MADGTLAEGPEMLEGMKRVVIAWPGYTGYMGPCFKALAGLCELRVYIEPSKYEQQFDSNSMAGVEFRRVASGLNAAVEEEIRAFGPDLTLICGWNTPMSRALARTRLPGRKVLAFDMPWEWSFRKFAARWVLWPHLRHFDAAFVPGNRCARYARWLGFRGNRLVLGANPSGWERFGETTFSSERLPSGGFLFVGRFVAAKGLDVLLAAYAAYRQRSAEPWDLDLVGCGDALPQRLPEGVRVVGFVKPQDIPMVLRNHRCLVLPSRWEPWGVCAAEAMSAGLATILSSACGLVDDARPTLTVPPGDADALARAMVCISEMSSEELKREGARARAAVEQFSAARWAQRVMEFLHADDPCRKNKVGRKFLHLVPGLNQKNNGIAVAAKLIASGHGGELIDCSERSIDRLRKGEYDEVWVHSMWLPQTMLACWRVLKRRGTVGKPRLVRVAHANLDPVRLRYHGWKKQLVGSIERWLLRRADKVVATCEAEKKWILDYEPRVRAVEIMDLKRFFKFQVSGSRGQGALHVLYLGRRHPLKGVEFLERAVREVNDECGMRNEEWRKVELRIVSDHFGEELERDWAWCDVLCLPTLSENFGLVVAEALERGKRVVTTDGAPAWAPPEAVKSKSDGAVEQWRDRICYLRGFRDGTDEEKVRSLKEAVEKECDR